MLNNIILNLFTPRGLSVSDLKAGADKKQKELDDKAAKKELPGGKKQKAVKKGVREELL
jgi:hypothetical protein